MSYAAYLAPRANVRGIDSKYAGAKKLKCTGEPDGCARCAEEGVLCQYSHQKQMGRPRKRRREGPEQSVLDAGTVSRASHALIERDPLTDMGQNNTPVSLLDGFPAEDFGWDLSDPGPLPELDQTIWHAPLDVEQSLSDDYSDVPVQIQDETSLLDIPEIFPTTQSPFSPPTSLFAGSNVPKCACLPHVYISLSSFQTLPAPSFPLTLNTLAKATTLARSVLRCPECPKTQGSALQNLMLLSTLLALIVHEHSRLLAHIEERAARDPTITLRVAELSSLATNAHLHTGTPDCPLGFNLTMSAADWRTMARKAIRQEILGIPDDPAVQGMSLSLVVQEMERRQKAWHAVPEAQKQGERDAECAGSERNDFSCLSMVRNINRSLGALDL